MSHADTHNDGDHHPARKRNHKFESFSQRVARLKIDPIRRNRAPEFKGDDLQSYFKTGFDRWKELNLSDSFSRFVQQVEPLCDSLPQVLYHNARIVALLQQYLEERNVLSLEPLLDLTSCLAHDLGVNFEDCFPGILALVLDIAAKHTDIEVVEWSFSSLAWLFKYLSRLLVPDLRPTYNLMAATLGKDNHKPFIARFAAEAMSFLVRKVASAYSKDRESLQKIVQHIFADFDTFESDSKHIDVYRYGIMTLFANAIKGVGKELHTMAPVIYQCLLDHASTERSKAILLGVTTSCIHYTNADTIEPMRNIIFDSVDRLPEFDQDEIEKSLSLMMALVSVRNSTRVQNWELFLSKLTKLAELITTLDVSGSTQVHFQLARITAVVFSIAPLDACMPHLRLIDLLSAKLGNQLVVELCVYQAELDRSRFEKFFLPIFLKLLATSLENQEHLNLLAALHISSLSINLDEARRLPMQFQKHITHVAKNDLLNSEDLVLLANYLELVANLQLEDSIKVDLQDSLANHFNAAVSNFECIPNHVLHLHLTTGLGFLLRHSQQWPSWNEVIRHLRTFAVAPLYLENVQKYLRGPENNVVLTAIPDLVDQVVHNLSSPSKRLRHSSLLLLQDVYMLQTSQKSPTLSTALELESLTLDIKSARAASMLVRRLAEQYSGVEEASWLAKAIPTYCFGLLHFKLSQIWTEAIEAIKQMASRPNAANVITEIVFRWLEMPKQEPSTVEQQTSESITKYNEFQCSSQSRTFKLFKDTDSILRSAKQQLQTRFENMQKTEPRANRDSQVQAFRVLKALPELAEKRSRRLVPVFLRNPHHEDVMHENVQSRTSQQNLSRREQLDLLEVFERFTNPRMLYRTSEVYVQLLHYLSSGDAKIQASALRALSTWKLPVFDKYLTNLNNLLDENRFREELSTFLTKDRDLQDIDFDELLPFLTRVLYGRAISRIGSTSSQGSLLSKRRAIFDALARLNHVAIQEFTNIALGPLITIGHEDTTLIRSGDTETQTLPQRQQLGMLNLLKDMIDSLGEKISSALPSIIPAILFCGEGVSETDADSMAKEIRKSAIQCLTSISIRIPISLSSEYITKVIQIFVNPRLENLAAENSQSISALLQLLAAWAANTDTALWLTIGESKILDAVTQILIAPSVKDNVLLYIMEQILKSLAYLANMNDDPATHQIQNTVIRPNMEHILERLGLLLQSNPEKRVLASLLSLLSVLAGSVESSKNTQVFLRIAALLLTEPAHRISPKSKNDVLGFLIQFVPLSGLSAGDDILSRLEMSLLPLLFYSRDRESRASINKVLLQVACLDSDLQRPATICSDLDAFSTNTIDEPDFNRRLKAFSSLEKENVGFSARQWRPVLYSLLYHIQDTQELAIRTSSSRSLNDFVKILASTSDQKPEIFSLLDTILLPNLRKGVTQTSELVRLEYLSIFAEIVKRFPLWDKVNDLNPLLVNDDEEASFFSNILHIQQHRRLRALRRLAGEAVKGHFRSVNIAHFLIPLLEHFVLDQPEDKTDHNVVYETITTLGTLALSLEWPQFRAMYKRYTTYILTNPNLEKAAIRLLSMMTDSLNQCTKSRTESTDSVLADQENLSVQTNLYRLGQTLPKGDKLSEDIAKNLATPLRQYVHHKDETLVSQRVPVSITVAKLIMLLDENDIIQQLPPLLTDVCQILRSRAQESRDLARKTLIEISKAIGSPYFGFILKELRTALPRGYQLHVLSFSVHALLVVNEPACQNGELDYTLDDVANIIMDDIFGATGQEKDAEDYVSQMKEVKSNKSYDSAEIMARISSLSHINKLLRPVMALLEERIDLRMLKKVDELLRRFGVGLLRNKAVGSQEALVLCFELLQQVFSKTQSTPPSVGDNIRRKRFLINMKSTKVSNVTHGTTSALHKLGRFGLDLLRMILSRHEDLQTPRNLSGFMPIVGEAIMSNYEEIQVSAIRLLATIIRAPLEQLDRNASVYVSQAMALIKNATSANSEASQAALKLITVLLRDRDNVNVRDTDVAYILNRIKADLDEPDRQGIIFNFLKAVLHRKVIVAEVYEVMDSMAALKIQNLSPSTRNAARTIYIQFLANYPQGKDRLKQQWGFLIKNLSYEFAEGRQSVMETVHLLLGKVGNKIVQDIITNFFAPVVLITVNDESSDCRKMAALLLKEFFEYSNDDTILKMLILLRSWLAQEDSDLLFRTSLQIFVIYLEANAGKAKKEVSLLKQRTTQMLENIDYDNAVDGWETVYFSLQLLFKLVQTYPDELLSKEANNVWTSVVNCSHFPHTWVKTATSKLLGLYFADFARTNAQEEFSGLPLLGSKGLSLDLKTITSVLRSSLNALKLSNVNEELAKQLVKNVVFLGRLSASIPDEGTFDRHNEDNSADMEDNDDNEDSNNDNDNDPNGHHPVHPLTFIFSRVSTILRRETVSAKASAMVSKVSAIQLLAALCSHISAPKLLPHAFSIILPLYLLTDPTTSIPFSTDEGFKTATAEVKSNAQELMSLVQSKLGTSAFVDTLGKVREHVNEKRGARRVKRRIDTVSAPELTGLKRLKKRTQQREKKKEKNASYRAQRRGW